MKLFGSVGAFTAKVETRVLDQSQNEIVRMPMDFAALDGKVRLDIDLGSCRAKTSPPSTLASSSRRAWTALSVSFGPTRRSPISIYPGVQSYQQLAHAQGRSRGRGKGSEAGEDRRSARKPSMAILA